MQSAHPKRRRSAPKRHAEPLQHAEMPPHGAQIGRINPQHPPMAGVLFVREGCK